jgi:dihydrolipoamide dehydrogenase
MKKNKKHNLVIIGAGPGGYRAAFMAADLGLETTLIGSDKNPGGVCLYKGCIPTKALLHLAKIKKEAESAGDLGLTFTANQPDIKKVAEWKNKVVEQLTGGLGQLVKTRKINYIQGMAKFIDSHNLEVAIEGGDKNNISFEHAIIATGAKPVELPALPFNHPKIMDSDQSLELEDMPNELLIVGGGYIGLEMATIYNALGSKVSITELTSDFMPGMDNDLVKEYKKASGGLFQDIFLKTKVAGFEEKGGQLEVQFETKDKDRFKKKYDKILVAVGQTPNTKGIGLENTSIELDKNGFVKIDEKQRTTEKHIFAIGDITGGALLAHKASHEGKIAAETIAGKNVINDAKIIPAVVYTEPEIATAGLSEKQAREKGRKYKAVKFPWSASGRALAMNEKNGITKLLVDPDTERILGAGIVGKNAGDMIIEISLAIEMAATAQDLALTVHPHPTLSETIMEAAEMFYGHPAHTFVKK